MLLSLATKKSKTCWKIFLNRVQKLVGSSLLDMIIFRTMGIQQRDYNGENNKFKVYVVQALSYHQVRMVN